MNLTHWYKTLLLLLFCTAAQAQQDSVWTAFFDAKYNRGFKDANGKVMIEPKFAGLTTAMRFDKVIPVMEADGYKMYYLLKNGRQFGRDSVWTLDTTPDCESEGLIKFFGKDEKVGMFNGEGKVAIPAEYSALSQCRNGYIIALKGAEKSYWHKNEKGGCNHWSWKGGTNCLIDKHNNILVTNFDRAAHIDFYSVLVMDSPSADPARVSFKGANGKYYSFTDQDKLFAQFLEKEILANLTKENLIAHSYPKIIYWDNNGKGWTGRNSTGFITDNSEIIIERLKELAKPGADYSTGSEYAIICPDEMEAAFEPFKDNCGQLNMSKYPLMEIIINHEGKAFSQDHFSFLKTDEGFKLLGVTLCNAVMK